MSVENADTPPEDNASNQLNESPSNASSHTSQLNGVPSFAINHVPTPPLQPRKPSQPPQSSSFNRFAVRKVQSRHDVDVSQSPNSPNNNNNSNNNSLSPSSNDYFLHSPNSFSVNNKSSPLYTFDTTSSGSIFQLNLQTNNANTNVTLATIIKDIDKINGGASNKYLALHTDRSNKKDEESARGRPGKVLERVEPSVSLAHSASSYSDTSWLVVSGLDDESKASSSIHKLMEQAGKKDTYKQNLEDAMILQHLVALKIAFEKADTDKSGGLDMDEFVEAFGEVLGKELDEQQLQQLFMKIDANSDGMVSWDEFSTFMILDNQNSRNLSQHENSVELVQQIFKDKNDPRVYHREAVQRIVPIGKRDIYVTTSRDGTLRWWKPAGLRHMHTTAHAFFNKPPGGTPRITPRYAQESAHSWITDAVYMPGTNKLAVSSMDRRISFYDVWSMEEQEYHITNLQNAPLSMHHIVEPSHSCLLIGDDHGYVKFFKYSLEDMNLHSKDNEQWITSAISNDEKKPVERKIHDDWVNKIRFYPELNSMVTASSDKTLRFADVERGKLMRVLEGHQRAVMTFDFSPAHNILASGGAERDILLWNPWISRPLGSLIGHNSAILDIVISESDNLLISLSGDRLLKVWDLRTHACLQTFKRRHEKSKPEDMISTLYHDTSRDWIVSGDEKLSVYLICRHLRKGNDVKSHEFPITAALYNSNFQQVVTGDSNSLLTVWNAITGEKLARFPDVHGRMEITAMAFDSIPEDEGSGRRLITGARDDALKVWNFNTGQKLKDMLKTEPWEVTAIKFLRQVKLGRKLVIGVGWNRHVCVWQEIVNQKRAELFTELVGHTDDVLGIDFSEPNLLATSSYDVIFIWNLDSGYPRFTLSVNKEDGRVGLEELIAIEKVLFLHKKRVGNYPPLLSCGNDGCLRIWDVDVGKQIVKLNANHQKGESLVALSSDSENTVLLTGDSKGYIQVWDISHFSVDDPRTFTKEYFRSAGYWRAHAQNLVALEYVEKWRVVFTASTDCTARLWTIEGVYIGTFGQEVPWKINDPKTYRKEKPSDIAQEEEVTDYKGVPHRRPNSSLLSDIISTYKERDKAARVSRVVQTSTEPAPSASFFHPTASLLSHQGPKQPPPYQPSFSSSFENNYSNEPPPPAPPPQTTSSFHRRKLVTGLSMLQMSTTSQSSSNLLALASPRQSTTNLLALASPRSSMRVSSNMQLSASYPAPNNPTSPKYNFNSTNKRSAPAQKGAGPLDYSVIKSKYFPANTPL